MKFCAPPLGACTFKLRLGFWSSVALGGEAVVGGVLLVLKFISRLITNYDSFFSATPDGGVPAAVTFHAMASISGTIGKLCSLVSNSKCCKTTVFTCKSVGKSSVRDSRRDKMYGAYCVFGRHPGDLGTNSL